MQGTGMSWREGLDSRGNWIALLRPPRHMVIFVLSIFLVLVEAAVGQGPSPQATPKDSVVAPPRLSSDTMGTRASAVPDTVHRPKSRVDTILVVRHRFNHREQIITGSVVMSCLALMMVVMNNYNPR